MIFSIALLVRVKRAQHKNAQWHNSINTRLDIQYIRCKVLVITTFKTYFPPIHRLAKNIISTYQPVQGSQEWYGLILMGRLESLYDELCKKSKDKNLPLSMIHKATHFEIKKNCMSHPFDILGGRISKTIESGYNDIRNIKENHITPIRFRRWFVEINHFLSQHLWNVHEFDKNSPSDLIRLIVFGLAMVLSTALGLLMLITFGLWIEVSLIILLMALNTAAIGILKRKYLNITLASVTTWISTAVFLSLGLYLYDNATDIGVAHQFGKLLRLSKSDEQVTFSDNQTFFVGDTPTYIFLLSKYSTKGKRHPTVEDPSFTGDFLYLFPLIILGLIALCSLMFSLSSLPTLLSQIKTTLFMNGIKVDKVIKDKNEEKTKIKEKSEIFLTTKDIITRNKLSIEEAGFESIYQFMFQWAFYFTFAYWMSLAKEATKGISALGESAIECQEPDLKNNVTVLPNFICEWEEHFSFSILWRSGVTGMLSMSLSQLKSNAIQHEHSISLIQKCCYLLASILNTLSYCSLTVLLATNLYDVVALSQYIFAFRWYPNPSILCWLFPFFIKFPVRIITKYTGTIKYIGSTTERLLTKVASISSPFSFQYFYVLTSQAPQAYGKWHVKLAYMSYNHKNSPYIRKSFINQSFQYINFCLLASFVGIINILMLFWEPTLNNLPVTKSISPSEISWARYRFLLSCCIMIPFGYVLSALFLHLYFKFDDGYFTMANAQFEFSENTVFRSKMKKVKESVLDCFSMRKAQKEKEDTKFDRGQGETLDSHDNDFGTEEEYKQDVKGDWLDLSNFSEKGEELATENDFKIRENSESGSVSFLDEYETIIFNKYVKNAFPYYRNN